MENVSQVLRNLLSCVKCWGCGLKILLKGVEKMTNEEAICLTGNIQFDLTDGYYQREDYIEALCVFDRLIQENAKLKAENNRLNGKSEMYRDMADSFCNSNIKLKAEIEQLKSELEQLVKLPFTCDNCKYADFMGVESEHFYCMNHKHYMNVGGYCSFGEKEEPWQTAERTGVK